MKHLIEDHCTDQAQKAKRVLSAVSLIFVISIYLFILFINVSLSYNTLISFNSAGLLM